MGEQFTVTLPEELAQRVRDTIRSGEYASVDELVGEALRQQFHALAPRPDDDVERWLRTDVVAAILEYEADPGDVLTLDEVKASIEETYRRRGDAQSADA